MVIYDKMMAKYRTSANSNPYGISQEAHFFAFQCWNISAD